jgi:anti-sigma B factor antagonist
VGDEIALQGRITIENSGEVRKRLLNALRAKPAGLSLDLSGVTYIDTSCVATLIEAFRIARKQGTRLTLAGLHDQPQYFIQVTHFDQLFEIEPQEAKA